MALRLCGVKSHEYTNATTGGMISAETGEFDPEIIRTLGLPAHLFHPLEFSYYTGCQKVYFPGRTFRSCFSMIIFVGTGVLIS